jgi:hypothetical protein
MQSMTKKKKLGLFLMFCSLTQPGLASSDFYEEGAMMAKKRNHPLTATRFLANANTSLTDTLKISDCWQDQCRDTQAEQEMKTLIQTTHEKTQGTSRDPAIGTIQNNQGDTPLLQSIPGMGYCDTTDCVFSKATVDPPASLAPLQAWLAFGNTTHDFDGAQVLTGELSHCRDTMGHYSQCCGVARGFGQDLHLAHCTVDEKALSQQRAKGLCLAVGSRCKQAVLGQCLVHEKFYCCYQSALLRDVREGVFTQLHLGFGAKHHPHCRGISLSQLQALDFTKQGFSRTV